MGALTNKINDFSTTIGNSQSYVKNSKTSFQEAPNLFISVWKTDNLSTGSSLSNQITLPLNTLTTYDMTVYWGDGASTYVSSGFPAITHTYSSPGTYTVIMDVNVVNGLRGFSFNNSGDRLKLLSITQWGYFRPVYSSVFYGCSNLNLEFVSDIIDLSETTAIDNLFRNCTSLTTVNNMNNWDISNIGSFLNSFNGCSLFNQDISNWDVSSGVFFNGMFQNCTLFNQDISGWNVSNGTNFNSMLRSCTAFNQNLGSWDVSKASTLSSFMTGKTNADFSASNLDAIYNGWSLLTFVNTGLTISFGTIKYTAAGVAGRAILTGAPNNWSITDGGI